MTESFPPAPQDRPAGAQYVVGVDYGTLSGRALLLRLSDGAEVASRVLDYPHGVMSREVPGGPALPPEWALQHPQDYLDVLAHTVPAVLAQAEVRPEQVVGLGIDFTACTVLPTRADGTPLCFLPGWERRPHAYVKLWKHHAAQPQADRLNAAARERGEGWLARYGGLLSSEWALAKGLHLLEEDPEAYAAAERFIEAADWVIWQLTGRETRNVCTAGYKAAYQDGAYPSREYFASVNPAFADFADKLRGPLVALGECVGGLSAAGAELTGLLPGTAVAAANVDAHVTAPAVGAVGAGQLVAIMGTSTCHVMTGEGLKDVPGMCGVVEGGILPGQYGYEAGQSGVGDIFAWFVENAVPAKVRAEADAAGVDLHTHLSALAAGLRPGQSGLLALDWLNGNRSVLVDADLTGLVVGLHLHTRPEEIYRALLEATAFGTRVIVENFGAAGVPVTEFIAAGGLVKNAFLMQLYADVLNLPVSVADTAQAPALGSAMHAAVAAGVYPDIGAAAAHLARVKKAAYRPNPETRAAYDALYAEYLRLHDAFGRQDGPLFSTMKTLGRLRRGGNPVPDTTPAEAPDAGVLA